MYVCMIITFCALASFARIASCDQVRVSAHGKMYVCKCMVYLICMYEVQE